METVEFIKTREGSFVNKTEISQFVPLHDDVYRVDLRRVLNHQPYLFADKKELIAKGVVAE
jgi:hypothetical protein